MIPLSTGRESQQTPLPSVLYHLADEANWTSIQQHGLLSTSALLDLLGLQGEARAQVERQHRTHLLTLADDIVIRDQKPMPPSILARCLPHMTPEAWYALLNSKVFFWLDRDRLNRMLRANRGRPQLVLTLDTAQLLAAYADQIALTPINTGNARRRPATRGQHSFVPYQLWSASGWAYEAEALGTRVRPRNHQPAELTLNYALPDAMKFVRHVTHLESGARFEG